MQPDKSDVGQAKIMQMVKSVNVLLELAKSHGLGVILLAGFSVFIYTEKVNYEEKMDAKVAKLEKTVEKCNAEILQIYQEQNSTFKEALINNTEAIKTFSVFIQNHNK